ncbi:MAG: acyl--CoA ligase [Myxococcales bacterium]|nr:acyl--CoA ligase [Myxococcales bacterium]
MPFPDYVPTVPVFLRELVARHGERELIVKDDERLSFAEAERRSGRLARALLAEGVGKGARVGILFPNGPEWVVAWLAATRIGAVAVPINTFYQARELGWTLRHADVDTLLTTAGFLSHDYVARLEAVLPELAGTPEPRLLHAALPFLRRIAVWGGCDRPWALDGAALAAGEAGVGEELLRAVEAEVHPSDEMVMLYSSGSTSDPKGALHTHAGVLKHSYNLTSLRDLGPDDRVWSPMPFFWVGGFVFAFLGNLQAGATTLCEEAFDPGRTLAFLERERASVAVGWPHFGKALAEHPDARTRDLSALRAGNVPEILPEEIVPRDPRRRGNALGMTETCGPHTWSDGPLPEKLAGSFGRAVPGVEHKIVDPETGETLPPGTLGEICVRGYSLMQRLHKVPREETFDADGFYRTGDAGCFDAEGVLWFEARLGDMIKSGGANVSPSEVEAVLADFPEIAAGHVLGIPDAERGETVAAAIVLEPGARLDASDVQKRVKSELSAYKVPRRVVFYEADALPFTDSGKIDKRRLREQLAARD